MTQRREGKKREYALTQGTAPSDKADSQNYAVSGISMSVHPFLGAFFVLSFSQGGEGEWQAVTERL